VEKIELQNQQKLFHDFDPFLLFLLTARHKLCQKRNKINPKLKPKKTKKCEERLLKVNILQSENIAAFEF
jgi:hypothetical protein